MCDCGAGLQCSQSEFSKMTASSSLQNSDLTALRRRSAVTDTQTDNTQTHSTALRRRSAVTDTQTDNTALRRRSAVCQLLDML